MKILIKKLNTFNIFFVKKSDIIELISSESEDEMPKRRKRKKKILSSNDSESECDSKKSNSKSKSKKQMSRKIRSVFIQNTCEASSSEVNLNL